MVKNPTVFIADDYILGDTLRDLERELTERGIRVIRGPASHPGMRTVFDPADYGKLFGDAHVLMFNSRSVCDRQVVFACTNALAFINPTCGMETVDLEAVTRKGCIAGNGAIPENVNSVAEASVCAMLMLSHQTLRSIQSVKNGYEKPPAKESWSTMLCGKKVGLVGFGHIGMAAAERLRPFGVEILAASPHLTPETAPPYVRACALEELLRESDFVSLYVAINKSTYQMINAGTLAMMKPTAYLINTSRGDAVDEDALYEALRAKKLAGAALDTFHVEPLPLQSRLRTLDNVILTPHMAGATIDNFRAVNRMAVHNILAVLNGELPAYCKNPEIGDAWKESYRRRDDLAG